MTKSIMDILEEKCIKDIMDQEDSNILEILGCEPTVSYIESKLKTQDKRKYIGSYIKKHSYFRNLKTAVQNVCPEHEAMLERLVVLK